MAVFDKDTCAEAVAACACFNFARASRSVSQLFNATLQPSGLRSTQFVLLAVTFAEEPVALTRLAQALVVDRSTLSRNLKPLEADGLLSTAPAKGQRGKVARITAKGRRKLVQAVPLWEQAQQQFVESFGAGRWKGLLKGLAAAVDAKRTI